jgi:hypothetical protein
VLTSSICTTCKQMSNKGERYKGYIVHLYLIVSFKCHIFTISFSFPLLWKWEIPKGKTCLFKSYCIPIITNIWSRNLNMD